MGERVPATSFSCSIPTLEPTRIAIGARSLYSWLGGFFLLQHFAGGIETKHQQLN